MSSNNIYQRVVHDERELAGLAEPNAAGEAGRPHVQDAHVRGRVHMPCGPSPHTTNTLANTHWHTHNSRERVQRRR